MKVKLERTFPMPGTTVHSWSVLSDIRAVAGCMPGAALTEEVDATHYKGTVAVKLGPANLKFRGEIEVLLCDPATQTFRMAAKGTDTTGASVASMDLTARVEAAADGLSALRGESEATVGGKAAALGSRMMDAVSDQILKQFAANFAAKVAAVAAAAAAVPGAEDGAGTGTASGPMETRSGAAASGAPARHAAEAPAAAAGSASSPTSVPAGVPAMAAAPPPAVAVPPPAQQLDGLALIWAVIRAWFRGLFGRK